MTAIQQPTELVLDTNVFVAGLLGPRELTDLPEIERVRQHDLALPFIEGLKNATHSVHVPNLCILEVCAVVRRRVVRNSFGRALAIKGTLEQWTSEGKLVIHDLDASSLELAINSALHFSVGGADALFVELSDRLSIPLKTFDDDVVKKYPKASKP